MTLLPATLALIGILIGIIWVLVRCLLPMSSPSREEILTRIRTWGLIFLFLLPVLLAPSPWPYVLLGLVSFLAFKEFITLTPARRQDRWAFLWAYIAIPLQYLWAGMAWYGMFIVFIPVYLFLFLPGRMVLAGHPKGFLRATATLHWGLMTTVYSLSHMAYLLSLPDRTGPYGTVSGASLLFLLLFLTEINDVAQFVWSRPWVMRCRSQAEMDALAAEAGFVKIAQRMEPQGIFSVALARRTSARNETSRPNRQATRPPRPSVAEQ